MTGGGKGGIMDEREGKVRMRAGELLGATVDNCESPLTVLASPAWRGVEGAVWRASAGGRSVIVKHYHPDTAFYVDPSAAIAAARQAAAAGAGPMVLAEWPADGMFAMEDLHQGWRAGGLQDNACATTRANIIAAKKAIQSGPALGRAGDIFADIRRLHDHARDLKSALLPKNTGAFLDFADRAEAALSALGADRVPCHRDGNTANLMVGPDKAVKLLDYDMAADSDPYEDAGTYLMEMHEREPEARAGFEEWFGRFDEGLFQRAMTYGILDDLRWGLIATGLATRSDRPTLEFAKYASWRYLRFEQNAQRSLAGDRLRTLR